MRLVRTARRAVTLGLALLMCIIRYWRVRVRGPLTLEQRALWLQACCRGVLRSLDIRPRVHGQPPARGLVVSNHLSYLDILILASAMPCFFVAKREIRGWPFFGTAARLGGTIFLDRASLASAASVADEMSERLKLPIPVLLFPEGTSTDGVQVLPFHTRLVRPATSAGVPITAASVRYELANGVEEKELCWYGDVQFLPHLLKTLGVEGFSAEVFFGQPRVFDDPRLAAQVTRDEVVSMRAGAVSSLR